MYVYKRNTYFYNNIWPRWAYNCMFEYEGPDRSTEFMDISNNNHLKCLCVENDNLTESLNGIY